MTLEPPGGAILRWPDDNAEDRGVTVRSVAKKDSKRCSLRNSSCMINIRVDDRDALLTQLRNGGGDVVQGPE